MIYIVNTYFVIFLLLSFVILCVRSFFIKKLLSTDFKKEKVFNSSCIFLPPRESLATTVADHACWAQSSPVLPMQVPWNVCLRVGAQTSLTIVSEFTTYTYADIDTCSKPKIEEKTVLLCTFTKRSNPTNFEKVNFQCSNLYTRGEKSDYFPKALEFSVRRGSINGNIGVIKGLATVMSPNKN